MGGELLYFAAKLDPPRWQRCNTSLYAAHLDLTWHNPDQSQESQFFKLTDLDDVYSVSTVDVHTIILSTLREGESVHGFEAIFSGKIERFAALAPQARWDWIGGLLYDASFSYAVAKILTLPL